MRVSSNPLKLNGLSCFFCITVFEPVPACLSAYRTRSLFCIRTKFITYLTHYIQYLNHMHINFAVCFPQSIMSKPGAHSFISTFNMMNEFQLILCVIMKIMKFKCATNKRDLQFIAETEKNRHQIVRNGEIRRVLE